MMTGRCHCGAVSWEFDKDPERATACNCTVCRRYGVMWIYGKQDKDVRVRGETTTYMRGDKDLGFHFCPTCGCVAYWRGVEPGEDGFHNIAVNVRLAEPDVVADLPVRHFDGLTTWSSKPEDNRCVKDLWF